MTVKEQELPELIQAAVKKVLSESRSLDLGSKSQAHEVVVFGAKGNAAPTAPARFPWPPLGLFFIGQTGAEAPESIKALTQ